jgi:ABC-type dipeptide/oligopeptide/nickel transport system permease subunit
VTGWPASARVYCTLILRERASPYVEAATALGGGPTWIVGRHILPNVIGPAAVLATANFGGIILSLASLSFLGLEMQPPTPEWGRMFNAARVYFQRYPLQMIAPGGCIAPTVLAVSLAGDALRDRVAGAGKRRGDPMTGARRPSPWGSAVMGGPPRVSLHSGSQPARGRHGDGARSARPSATAPGWR